MSEKSATCAHPDHVEWTSCLDRAVGCSKTCPCCMETPPREGPTSVRELVMRCRSTNGNPPFGREVAHVLAEAVRQASEVAFGFCPARLVEGHEQGTCVACSIGKKILWYFNEEGP